MSSNIIVPMQITVQHKREPRKINYRKEVGTETDMHSTHFVKIES